MRPVRFLCMFLHEIQGGKIISICGHTKFPLRFCEYDHCCLQNSLWTLKFLKKEDDDFFSGFEMPIPLMAKQYSLLAHGFVETGVVAQKWAVTW